MGPIRPGETFEFTTVMRFDPVWVEQIDADWQSVRGTADYTFKLADRTYQFSSREYAAVMDVQSSEYSGTKYFSLDTSVEGYTGWDYRLSYWAGCTGNMYSPPTDLLASSSYEYTYSAPFRTHFDIREFVSTEPTADLDTNVTSIHLLVSSVPEPATYAMLGAGLGLMAISRRKRRTETETSPA